VIFSIANDVRKCIIILKGVRLFGSMISAVSETSAPPVISFQQRLYMQTRRRHHLYIMVHPCSLKTPPCTQLSQESLHEVINKATLPEEGQETISISCPMYVIGANIQRGVWFVVKIWRKPKSAVTGTHPLLVISL
jgi:hypothetical protein